MTVEDILNIDNIDDLHKIIIHHEVEIEELKKQNTLLQMEVTSLNGFYIRQKEFNESHIYLSEADAMDIYDFVKTFEDKMCKELPIYRQYKNIEKFLYAPKNERG